MDTGDEQGVGADRVHPLLITGQVHGHSPTAAAFVSPAMPLLKIREKVAGISSGCWGRNQSLACCHLEVLSSVPRYAVAEYTGMQLRVSELHSSRLTNHSYHLDTNRKPYALLVTSDILHTLHTIHTLYVKIVERFLNQTLF